MPDSSNPYAVGTAESKDHMSGLLQVPGVRSAALFLALLLGGPVSFLFAVIFHRQLAKALASITSMNPISLEVMPMMASLLGIPLIPVALLFWQLDLHSTLALIQRPRYSRTWIVVGCLVPGLNLVVPFRLYIEFRRAVHRALDEVGSRTSFTRRIPAGILWWGISAGGPIAMVMGIVAGIANLDNLFFAFIMLALLCALGCYAATIAVVGGSLLLTQALRRDVFRISA